MAISVVPAPHKLVTQSSLQDFLQAKINKCSSKRQATALQDHEEKKLNAPEIT
jgi:hypothetical protein